MKQLMCYPTEADIKAIIKAHNQNPKLINGSNPRANPRIGQTLLSENYETNFRFR